MKNKQVEETCDQLDAAVFSGDFLADPEDRIEFNALLERWAREVAQWGLHDFKSDIEDPHEGNN